MRRLPLATIRYIIARVGNKREGNVREVTCESRRVSSSGSDRGGRYTHLAVHDVINEIPEGILANGQELRLHQLGGAIEELSELPASQRAGHQPLPVVLLTQGQNLCTRK